MPEFQHYVEIWTTHHDKTVTLVRERMKNAHLAKFVLGHKRRMFRCDCRSSECEFLENDFGEEVNIEHTTYAEGRVEVGTFQFAGGE